MNTYKVTINVCTAASEATSAHYGFMLEAHSLEDAMDKASSGSWLLAIDFGSGLQILKPAAELCSLQVLSVTAESVE